MQVVAVDGLLAWCEGRGRRERINVLWLDTVAPGDWVYVVLGQARERLSAERAAELDLALDGLAAAMQGEADLDSYFPGITPSR